MVISTGFEPMTPGLGIRCSILLSYETSHVRPTSAHLHYQAAVDPRPWVRYMGRNTKGSSMRAEIEKTVAEIEQVLTLLRRHL
jgi:hypothetical protein